MKRVYLILILFLLVCAVDCATVFAQSSEYYALFRITGTDFEINVTFIYYEIENLTFTYVAYNDTIIAEYENGLRSGILSYRVGYYLRIIQYNVYEVAVLDENDNVIDRLIKSGFRVEYAYIVYRGDVELIDVKGFIVLDNNNSSVKSLDGTTVLGGEAEPIAEIYYLFVPFAVPVALIVLVGWKKLRCSDSDAQ